MPPFMARLPSLCALRLFLQPPSRFQDFLQGFVGRFSGGSQMPHLTPRARFCLAVKVQLDFRQLQR
ncbi:MAG: hypothetical protein OGMRLDGQ_001564, partial [Candidatus Fervidibacter sp.]